MTDRIPIAERDGITSPADLIAALGGAQRVAGKCMVSEETVESWAATECWIPPAWHLRFYLAAQSLGYHVYVAKVFDADAGMIANFAEGGRHV